MVECVDPDDRVRAGRDIVGALRRGDDCEGRRTSSGTEVDEGDRSTSITNEALRNRIPGELHG